MFDGARLELMPNPAFADHDLLIRVLAVWLVLIGVEFFHGILRTIFLVENH
jgi:hypothetical protein